MHQTDHQELLEMYLTSMTTAYDPHSTYVSPKNLDNFNIQMRLDLEGIGATLQFDDGYTVVKELIPGGAADKDGHLKPEDHIVGVGQGEDGLIVDMKLSDVVDLIRGNRGTTVRLEVIPSGKHERVIYNMVRDKVKDKDGNVQAYEDPERGTEWNGPLVVLTSSALDRSTFCPRTRA